MVAKPPIDAISAPMMTPANTQSSFAPVHVIESEGLGQPRTVNFFPLKASRANSLFHLGPQELTEPIQHIFIRALVRCTLAFRVHCKVLTLKNLAELSKKGFKPTCFNNVLRLKEITN